MEEEKSIIVNGYSFESNMDAEIAKNEEKKILLFRQKLSGRNAESMLAVYDKLLDDKVFQTPIGWEYLHSLQKELEFSGISRELIRPIPMYHTFFRNEETIEQSVLVKQRIKPSTKKAIRQEIRFKTSIFVNIILGFMIIAMFVIALNGNNPNILNYKQALQDQYASWEQELSDREEEIRQKEARLSDIANQ